MKLYVTFDLTSKDLHKFLDFLLSNKHLTFKIHMFKQMYATGDKYVNDVIIDFDDWQVKGNVVHFLEAEQIDYITKRVLV
jgi:hypothetical protein